MSTLHLLGTGSGLINPARHASACLYETGAGDLLFDCGEPVAATLAGRGYDWGRLRAVVLSHTHADHLGGLPMLIQQIHLARRAEPLTLVAPAEFAARVRDHLGLFYLFTERLGFELAVHPAEAGRPLPIGDVEIQPVPTAHLAHYRDALRGLDYFNACAAFGYRVTRAGTCWFYSGDLGSFGDIRGHLDGCRLAVIDSTHIGQAEVFDWAAAHRATLVILSHVSPHFDVVACRAEIERRRLGNARVAEDGELFELD
jgi:ribonuclease BN (tRNA processing enzyme)